MASECWTLPQEWTPVLDELAELSTAESEARKAGGQVLHTVRYGVALDEVSSASGLRLTVHTMSDCELATTPVGTFLLADSAAIDENAYEHGFAAAQNLHHRNRIAST